MPVSPSHHPGPVCLFAHPPITPQASETVLDTEGCNLLSVMSLDEVDATRTLSNDIIEVFRVLGIEACRRSLYNEIYRILESSAVNYRHLVRACENLSIVVWGSGCMVLCFSARLHQLLLRVIWTRRICILLFFSGQTF